MSVPFLYERALVEGALVQWNFFTLYATTGLRVKMGRKFKIKKLQLHILKANPVKEVKNMQRKVLILLAVILGVTIIGCNQAAPKPLQNQPGTSTPKVTTPQPNMERVLADRFAKLANEVSGVKASTVVVTKNADGNNYTVMVGVELNADMKGTASENVKKQVSDKIKKADKTVSKVLVTTDPDLITRLKDIANGVIQGKPVSSFANEIEELGKRIAPSMK